MKLLIIICQIVAFVIVPVTQGINVDVSLQTDSKPHYADGYSIYYRGARYKIPESESWDSSFLKTFRIAQIRTGDTAYDGRINDILADIQAGWITRKVSSSGETTIPEIHCHSDKYFSVLTTMDFYNGRHLWQIKDGVTIDLDTGKRVLLTDLINDFDQLIYSIKHEDVIFRVNEGQDHEIYEAPDGLIRYLNEMGDEKLRSMLDECSGALTDYDYKESVSVLLAKSTFYLEEGILVLALKENTYNEIHIFLDISKMQNNLKVPMW